MKLYADYFDEEKSIRPYESNDELLHECLALLDLLVESLLERKGGYAQRRTLSKGLVVTEKEIAEYLETPPYLREEERNPLLAQQLRTAVSHIRMRAERTGDSVRLPLWEVRRNFSLTEFEFLCVLLALSIQVDLKYGRLYAFLQDDITKKLPTLGLAHTLYEQYEDAEIARTLEILEEECKMSALFFEESTDNSPPLMTALVLRRRMLRWLLGDSGRSNSGKEAGGVFYPYRHTRQLPVFFPEELSLLEKMCQRQEEEPCFPYLKGKDGDGRTTLCSHYARSGGLALWILDLAMLVVLTEKMATVSIRRLLTELALSPSMLLVKNCEEELAQSRNAGILFRLLERQAQGTKIVLSGESFPQTALFGTPVYTMSIAMPGVHTRLAIWQYCTAEVALAEDICLEELADCYELTVGTVSRTVEQAVMDAGARGAAAVSREVLRSAMFRMNTAQFGALATRIKTVYDWEDLEISAEQRAILKPACNRYKLRNRIGEDWGLSKKNAYGNGVSILLYGPPGTGKTMAAQVIANEIGMELYRVDLSQIFSKYIGETEKNLAEVFEEAQKTNVILFFDEADALFTKRTDITNSNDKYANSETAYLLQKVEEYKGVSILATNLYQHFDSAFVRRITYAVHFDSPDEATRYKLWTTILPRQTPVSPDIDFHFLAKAFELSGSNIKAILYNAAYMGAADAGCITAAHIVKSMKYEFDKLGKMFQKVDFGMYAAYLDE